VTPPMAIFVIESMVGHGSFGTFIWWMLSLHTHQVHGFWCFHGVKGSKSWLCARTKFGFTHQIHIHIQKKLCNTSLGLNHLLKYIWPWFIYLLDLVYNVLHTCCIIFLNSTWR
jgi:hypothetical protein